MSASTTSSRRSFLKGGAIAAAPLAVSVPAAAIAQSEHRARAQRLQDEAEIRALHQAWLGKIATSSDASMLFADPNAGRLPEAVRGVAADHAGHQDRIQVATDGLSASGRFATLVELEIELPRDSTLAQMAHVQGAGVVRRREPRTLQARYAKLGDAWTITKLELTA